MFKNGKSSDDSNGFNFDLNFTKIFLDVSDKIGISGAIIFLLFMFIYNKGTPEQHKVIIDWIILRPSQFNWYSIIIYVTFIVIVGLVVINKNKRIKQQQNEIDRISDERNKLQVKLANRKLHSSGQTKGRKRT